MGVFVCDICGCVENTALGFYWGHKDGHTYWSDPNFHEKALCSACAPATFRRGEPSEFGVWHGKFPRRLWDGMRRMENRQPFPSTEGIVAWLRTSVPEEVYQIACHAAQSTRSLASIVMTLLKEEHDLVLSSTKRGMLINRLVNENPAPYIDLRRNL